MFKNNECLICNENSLSNNLYCYECNNGICLECCNKLLSRKSIIIEDKEIFVKYICPYCRFENNRHIKMFDKNEILEIYKNNLICYVNSYNKNKKYEHDILMLNNNNNNLKKKLQINNEYINLILLENKKLLNTINNLIDINKNNILKYDFLIKDYKKLFKKLNY